jgi:hypothetical protein
MKEIQAPNDFYTNGISVFLGGSIEMGTAEAWQAKIVQEFREEDITFLNPRRDDWDWSTEQSIGNATFYEQVRWENDALDYADIIIIYFDPNTKSPISLHELGLYARSARVLVCCPKGFWRKGNVDITCDRYSIPLVESYEELVNALRFRISVVAQYREYRQYRDSNG